MCEHVLRLQFAIWTAIPIIPPVQYNWLFQSLGWFIRIENWLILNTNQTISPHIPAIQTIVKWSDRQNEHTWIPYWYCCFRVQFFQGIGIQNILFWVKVLLRFWCSISSVFTFTYWFCGTAKLYVPVAKNVSYLKIPLVRNTRIPDNTASFVWN